MTYHETINENFYSGGPLNGRSTPRKGNEKTHLVFYQPDDPDPNRLGQYEILAGDPNTMTGMWEDEEEDENSPQPYVRSWIYIWKSDPEFEGLFPLPLNG